MTTQRTTKDLGPIRVEASDLIPTKYALRQDSPKPFNPSTIINVDVKKTGYARLEIFNALGQKVATLLNGTVEAGTQQYIWNAAGFPSGLYFYRFSTEGFTAIHKMVLMKFRQIYVRLTCCDLQGFWEDGESEPHMEIGRRDSAW